MRKLIFVLLLLVTWQAATGGLSYAEDVKLKMIVVNHSDTETRTLPVKTYLPKGVAPEDITDKGSFRVEYDFEKSLYYAYQDVLLKPQETVTLELAIRDIWTIPVEEVGSLKKRAQDILNVLKDSEYYPQAKTLTESIAARLDKISESQNSPGLDVEQKISNYETSSGILKGVKKDIGDLEDLVMEVSGPAALPAGAPEVSSVSAPKGEPFPAGDQAKAKNPLPGHPGSGTIKFDITVSNPSDEEKPVPVKYYFPSELRREHIIDSGGLQIAYDYQKGLQYVYKDAVMLAPDEKKEFAVTVKDIWVVPEQGIDAVKAHTEKLMGVLVESKYKLPAKSLMNKIIAALNDINANQNISDMSVDRHIADYRSNLIKFDEVSIDVAKLEKMVIQAGGSVGFAAGGAPKPEGVLRGAMGMELVGKSMFRGRAPNATTSWKIIWIIIGFLAMVSFLFFILWWAQIKGAAGKKREKVNE